MPIPIVNSLASWFLKKRFHQIELFLKYPIDVQNELLEHLLHTAKNTEIGKQYDFASISTYREFAERVPVTSYEDNHLQIERARKGESNIFWPTPIKWFAKSSGTTNSKSKFIPVSSASLEHCHYAASKDLLCMYLNNNPDANLFLGKSLRLGGSKELYKENATVYGDLSAILIDNMPFWAEYSSTPNNEVSLMADWELKMQAIVDQTIQENVTSLAGVPSWMLVLLNNVLESTGKSNLFEIWPNLEVYFHGGVNFDPYIEQYNAILPKDNFRYYEIYNASEGFFAFQDRQNEPGMLLQLDSGMFYEFIVADTFFEASPTRLTLKDVKIGVNYVIIISTNAGLWAYNIGDTVQFTSLAPFRVIVSGRIKHFISAFGEHVIAKEVEHALLSALKTTEVSVSEFTVAPQIEPLEGLPYHEWFIEFENSPSNIEDFATQIDAALQSQNSYYLDLIQGKVLQPLKITPVQKGGFQNYMKTIGKLGGQNKTPRLSNDRKIADVLTQNIQVK